MRFVVILIFILTLYCISFAEAFPANSRLEPSPTPVAFNPALLPSPSPGPMLPTPTPVESPNKTAVSDKTSFPLWLGAMGELVLNGHWSIGGGYGYTPGTFSNSIGSVIASMTEQASYQNLLHREYGSTQTPRLAFEYRTSKSGWNSGLALYYFSATGGIDSSNTLQSATGIDLNGIKNMLSAAGSNASIFSNSHIFVFELHTGYTFALAKQFGLEVNAGVAKILSSTFQLYSNSRSVDDNATAKNLYQKAESELGSLLSRYGLTPIASLTLRLSF